jgi:hypothetical protein
MTNRKWKKESLCVSGIWSCKFYHPNNLENKTKIISVLGQNGLRIKRFQKHEQSDINQALLKWFKHARSDKIPVSRPLLMMIFVSPKF